MGEDNFGFDVSDQDSQHALWVALLTNRLLTVKFLVFNGIEIVPIDNSRFVFLKKVCFDDVGHEHKI